MTVQRGWTSLRSQAAWPLVAGDALAFLVFAAIGRHDHGESGALVAVVGTALPFFAGWLAVAPWAGVYAQPVRGQPVDLARRTAAGWVAAWPVGLLFRAITLHRGIPVSFAVVTLLANAVLLISWRTLYARLRGGWKR
jgi:hypothetical protein